MPTLIKQACVLCLSDQSQVGSDGIGDVLIDKGKIIAIAPNISATPEAIPEAIPEATEVIEAHGQFLGPGLVDLYSRSGEPGNESRETYDSLRRAAAAGGFTQVGLLPNTTPAVDSVSAIETIQRVNRQADNQRADNQRADNQRSDNQRSDNRVRLLPWAAITHRAEGKCLNELAELAEAGAIGFTDSAPLTNTVLLRRLLEYALPLRKTIALWPCDLQLAGNGVAREGSDSLRLGLAGINAIAETTALTALLECVAEIPASVHIMRVSTARSVDLIRQAKERGLPVSASVAWHHLIFDTQNLDTYDPNLRHEPPLGTPADKAALIAGVSEGVIDAIAIEHSPYTYEENTVAFDAAPPGAIGLELALPILWQTLVAGEAQWNPEQLWRSLSGGPRQCLGLTTCSIGIGQTAELTLFDPNTDWQVSSESLKSLSNNTPWLNQTIKGKVVSTWMPEATANAAVDK